MLNYRSPSVLPSVHLFVRMSVLSHNLIKHNNMKLKITILRWSTSSLARRIKFSDTVSSYCILIAAANSQCLSLGDKYCHKSLLIAD